MISNSLTRFDQAYNALMEAKTIDEIKQVRDQAEALRLYMKQQSQSLDMQNACAEIKLRAERKAGELLRDMPKQDGGRPKKTGNMVLPVSEENHPPKLEDIGITKMQSSRFQAIASIPEEEFEEAIEETKREKDELTSKQRS